MLINKKKLLKIYPHKSSFVKKDIEILSSQYEVDEYEFDLSNKKMTPYFLLSQFVFLLFNLWKYEKVIITFAAYHSVLPVIFAKIFRKNCFIIIGGTDAHCFPSISYGNFHKKLLGFATCFSLKYCYKILPKHIALVKSNYSYFPEKYAEQGYQSFCPNCTTPFYVIENGYDASFWEKQKNIIKNNTFLSVAGNLQDERNILLKGVDLIFEVAPFFPDWNFLIIGGEKIKSKNILPNIILLPNLSSVELIETYSKAKFYFQLSMAEGFPNALCEAMLCECVPIGSNVFGIPDIIGETGHILESKNVSLLKKLMENAIIESKSGLEARKRIEDNFGINVRAKKLLKIIE